LRFVGIFASPDCPRFRATSKRFQYEQHCIQGRPEALIRYLLEGTSSETGQEFFQALVRSAALALDVAGVWVTEYLPERKVLRSLAFWMNGNFIPHYEYKIEGTPCEVVIERGCFVHYPERIIQLFSG